jgi:hypothetical protein
LTSKWGKAIVSYSSVYLNALSLETARWWKLTGLVELLLVEEP